MDTNLSVFDILKYVLFKMVSPLFDSVKIEVSCQPRNKEGVKMSQMFNYEVWQQSATRQAVHR